MHSAAFVRHVLIALGLVAAALFLWRVAYALLLAFGGVLFAVFLRGLAGKIAQHSPLGMRGSLAVVGVALAAIALGAAALIGPQIAAQADELAATITRGLEQVRGYLEQTRWGREVLSSATESVPQAGDVVGAVTTLFSGGLNALLGLVLVLFTGIYFAAAPRVYSEGVVLLFPRARRQRAREVLAATHRALWSWLLGQFVVMIAVGVLTATGLLIAGVPLAVPLGLIAGLLEFIPFLGPIVAFVPVILVALAASPQTALYAALVFLVIQQLESHLLTPLVQRWAVALPPVLVIIGAIAFALVFGTLGAIFATPLLVVAVVWVKMLYLHDALGE